METPAKILITGGVALLFYAFLVGFALARVRATAPAAPRYLVLTHLGGVITAAVLLALTLAIPLSNLSSGLETLAAWLLVGGGATVSLGDTTLWLGKAEDAFATKPIGFRLQATGATVMTAGCGILLVGVVRGL